MPTPTLETVDAITEDDATLASMLEYAQIPALMCALVHITGNADIIRGDIRPASGLFRDAQAGISTDDQAKIRKLALEKAGGTEG